MTEDGSPALEVGFVIDTSASFDSMARLDAALDKATTDAIAEVAKIEKAIGGMLDLGGATAAVTSFGNASTREMQAAAREIASVEKSGEAMVRSLERQNAAFGKTREELRGMKAEAAAVAAEQQGLTELAGRIRQQEAALVGAATAAREEAAATKRLADEHARLIATVRGSQAAQEADAAAAERLRAATDPLYAATSRLNAEIAESTRLYQAGATAPAEYARQQAVLTARLAQASAAHDATAIAARRGTGSLTQLSFQLNDVATMVASGAPVFQIFATQIGQIVQVAQMAEGGVTGLAGEIGGFLLRFAPWIGAMAAGTAGFLLFDRAVSKGIDTKEMVNGLGLTRAEIKRLKDTSVDTGDVVKATFQVMAQRVGLDLSHMSGWFGDAMDFMTRVGRTALAGLYSSFVGTFRGIGAIVQGVFSGKGIGEILSDVGDAYTGAFNEADAAMVKFGKDVTKQIASNKLADLQKQAAELKADRTPKTDRHAEQLEREDRAIEAQIRNLYALADAYGASGAAALIAEARVKAESDAIKKRGDIEAFVDRQIRLAIAQRVSEAAKSTAALRDQAQIQAEVNGMVAAGTIASERAAELVQQRIAELPLLAAIEAAQQRGLKREVEAATAALEAQRAAQQGSDRSAMAAQFNADHQAAQDRIDAAKLELSLVSETEEVRSRALAQLQAEQESRKYIGQFAKDYVADQMAAYDATAATARATRELNDVLNFTAEKWDAIAGSVESAAQGMASAFGDAGRAIGDLASTYARYEADRARLQRDHDAAIKAAGKNEAAIARENELFAIRSAGAQVGAYGDMTAAAKGFFKEGSAGYEALAAAEKAFRIVQFALSVQAMIQNAAETLGFVTNAAARATAEGTAGIASQSKLPFPLNIVAMAATGAALLAAGVALVGGGRGSSAVPVTNTGTGTVLGDATAKSDSIKRSIDQLREVDTLMLTSSRAMAASLRSIDAQISGFTSEILKAGDINASGGVVEGFKPNIIGSVLGAVPLIGGLLKSLFGSTTKVVGNGLYGGPQTIGNILAGGFDAQYYSDIEKTSKFFGITTGHSTSTQYSAADPALASQFTLILKSFNDAISAAAGPLGIATDDIKARLSGFVIDIGKIDLKDLTGEEIQAKLAAIFGAAADNMAAAAIPGLDRFQRVGEGAFETLVRVASTVETVTAAFDQLGSASATLGIDAKMGLAEQFDSLGDFTSAIDAYFGAFYTPAEQTAARAAQLGKVFASLNLQIPDTLAGFRQLIEAQDLNSAAGQAAYATLLQLAPAFADLAQAMDGAKSATEAASEQQDLLRQLYELQGNTPALRALDLARLDASNRALQEQIWLIQDAQAAVEAAEQLRDAWSSIGDTIMDEVKRIRGLTDEAGGGSYASLLAEFDAATAAARAGDQDAANSLPGLSQALLKAAADAATSRQELDRIQAMIAASLEATVGAIGSFDFFSGGSSPEDLLDLIDDAQGGGSADAANDNLASEIASLRAEVAAMRSDNNAGHAATASNTARAAKVLEDVSSASGGDAISVGYAA